MKDEYDFSKARKNPYAGKLKKEAVADKILEAKKYFGPHDVYSPSEKSFPGK